MPEAEDMNEIQFDYLPIKHLIPFPMNPRVHVDEVALQDLKRNIENHGLLEPLIVRPTDSHLYEVVAGNRRLAALRELHEEDPDECKDVLVQIWPWLKDDDAAAFQIAVTENVERESMNPYDETLALLRLFAMTLIPQYKDSHPASRATLNDLAGLLKSWSHRVESSRQLLAQEYGETVEDVQGAVDAVFKMREGLKLASFVNNRLPLLELPEDVQEALAAGKFPYAAAKEVSKIEDPTKRAGLISLAAEGMSYRQLIKQAKLMQNPAAENTNANYTEFNERAKQISKWLRKKPQLNQNDRKQLDAALRRIEDLVGK